MLRIDAAQQFIFVIAERDRMIALPRARLPCRHLARKNDCQPIEVGHQTTVSLLIEGEQSRLMREQLAHGDVLLAVLGKFRPVVAHAFLIIQPAT